MKNKSSTLKYFPCIIAFISILFSINVNAQQATELLVQQLQPARRNSEVERLLLALPPRGRGNNRAALRDEPSPAAGAA